MKNILTFHCSVENSFPFTKCQQSFPYCIYQPSIVHLNSFVSISISFQHLLSISIKAMYISSVGRLITMSHKNHITIFKQHTDIWCLFHQPKITALLFAEIYIFRRFGRLENAASFMTYDTDFTCVFFWPLPELVHFPPPPTTCH